MVKKRGIITRPIWRCLAKSDGWLSCGSQIHALTLSATRRHRDCHDSLTAEDPHGSYIWLALILLLVLMIINDDWHSECYNTYLIGFLLTNSANQNGPEHHLACGLCINISERLAAAVNKASGLGWISA